MSTAEYTQFESSYPVPVAGQQRSYQYLQLKNGLLVLLLTDPSQDVGSCCLSVCAGHHSDPSDIPGLAHLCEHMLCVSSKEYPSPDRYRTTVQQAGGMVNAVTNSERTSYYFSVPITPSAERNAFEDILSIFSANFRAPLFNMEDLAREIYAIDNEHANNKNSLARVSFYGYKLLANGENQFSRFSTGNFESLTESTKKYNIQSKLQRFFKENYTTDKMTVVLRGPQSLNYLRKMAVAHFSTLGATAEKGLFATKITNKRVLSKERLGDFNIGQDVWHKKYGAPAYTREKTGRGVLIQSGPPGKATVRIGFPISTHSTEVAHEKLEFLIDFFCEIMGDESSGSLAQELARNEYAKNIMTNASSVCTGTVLLEITFTLLPMGFKNFDTVLSKILEYVEMLSSRSKMSKHVAKSMSQFQGICLYNFLNGELDADPAGETLTLSAHMLGNLAAKGKWINARFTVFDETTLGYGGSYTEGERGKLFWTDMSRKFETFLSTNVTVENMIMSIAGDVEAINYRAAFETLSHHRDTYFGMEYTIVELDPKIAKQDTPSSMTLPMPNQFAPYVIHHHSDLLAAIKNTASVSADAALGYSIKETGITSKPILIRHDDGRQLWFKPESDTLFNDKAFLTVMLTPTRIALTVDLINAIEILSALLNDRLNTFLYPAMLVNYSFSLLPSTKIDGGIIIHVSGPKYNIQCVLAVIVHELGQLTSNFHTAVTDDEFGRFKRACLSGIEHIYAMPSCVLSTLGLYATLEEYVWPLESRVKSAEIITKHQVATLVKPLFESCYLTALLQGDIDASQYEDVIIPEMDKLVTKFEGQNTTPTTTVWLPENSNYKIHSFSKDASNVVTYFIQTNVRDDLNSRTVAKFVAYLMTTTLVGKLRGEYQLGYIVQVGFKSTRKTQGVCITIVNSSYNSETLDSKIDIVLMEWYAQLVTLKLVQFKSLVDKFLASEKSSNNLLGSTMGSASLSLDLFTVAGGERPAVIQHKSFWEQISTNVYAFSSNTSGREAVDPTYIENLSLNDVLKYIQTRILPNGPKRAKISILLDSDRSKEEMRTNNELYRLFTWLGSMGLPIKYEDFVIIAQQSGESKIAFGKNLFKYYRNKGKSLTLVTGVLAKMSRSIMFSFCVSDAKIEQQPATQIDIHETEQWRQQTGYVRDSVTLEQKLKNLA